ncbi:biotin transporter BioY [Salinibacterium amurskyense]|uniref:biotin transporter BioY n=1 Tax=Salinibacterium amurskyense TaxID=205941 RepID=UPI00311D7F72
MAKSVSERFFKPTMIDLIFGPSPASSVVFIAAAAGFTAIAAQLVVPLNPVPITAQTLAVMIVGLSLGATRAALAMLLYAALGLSGLPVFSNAQGGADVVAGTSGGYIIGYIAAAWLIGALAERGWNKTFWPAALASIIGSIVIYAFGMMGIARVRSEAGEDFSLAYLFTIGVAPFIVGALLKVTIAAALLSFTWKAVLQRRPRAAEFV